MARLERAVLLLLCIFAVKFVFSTAAHFAAPLQAIDMLGSGRNPVDVWLLLLSCTAVLGTFCLYRRAARAIGAKCTKADAVILAVCIAASAAFYLHAMVGRQSLYLWDNATYYNLQVRLESNFADGVFTGVGSTIYKTWFNDYAPLVINLLTEPFFMFTPRTANTFALLCALLIPSLVYYSAWLLQRVNPQYGYGFENGSGKTTLVKILMGFYDDYEGEIFINGINLRLINKENYRDKIGALFQDYGKYEATIRENIAYGNLKSLNDDAIIHTIAEKFNLQSFILQQKAGIDTQLGYWFDDGINISEGQWQKIALSRAFIKDADMYILDEPNAALDAISEYYLAQLYKQVLKDKLGIIIAHRFSNFIHETDKIIIMENGQIIETGKHSELFNKDGVYKRCGR